MSTGYIYDPRTGQVEEHQNPATGPESNWQLAPPFDGSTYSCNMAPLPFQNPSFIFDKNICKWVPPVDAPEGGNHVWDELTQSWIPAELR